MTFCGKLSFISVDYWPENSNLTLCIVRSPIWLAKEKQSKSPDTSMHSIFLSWYRNAHTLHLPCLFDCKFVSCNRCGSFVYDDFISVPTWFSPIIIACNDIEIESFDHFRLGCPTSSPYQYCISGVAHFTSFVKFKFMWSVSIIIDKCSKREHISFIESQTEYVQQCLSTHKKTV